MGGATTKLFYQKSQKKFQSTLPVGGATFLDKEKFKLILFQSTLPVGGATDLIDIYKYFFRISIHAPRGGSDDSLPPKRPNCPYFNPRSPWGERLSNLAFFHFFFYFNPRSPWGERQHHRHPKTGGNHFNPRSPWGERPEAAVNAFVVVLFQSTLPVGGATPVMRNQVADYLHFNPRSPWGERLFAGNP